MHAWVREFDNVRNAQRERAKNMAVCSGYLICSAERTGSTLLADVLIGTGIAGRPRSYFNRAAHFSPSYQRILGSAKDDDGYLGRVIAAATTPNGVFAAKVHWEHFLNLVAKVDRALSIARIPAGGPVPERLRLQFPDLRYIWLTRTNQVARAISHYRAAKTGRWQADARWTSDDTGGEGEPEFDFDAIDSFVRLGEVEDANWRRYFRDHDVAPLELTHEEVVRDLEGAVQRILQFLGVPVENLKSRPPRLRQQSDSNSREWEARYRRMLTDE
jgi:LPS sulfotransferase NodH